jgi:hypothetical protein|tara:strand:- start:1550 stop:2008 length:459 start_codon:yes stop_codon:yes gene_type:complete
MGLDVYLFKVDDMDQMIRLTERSEEGHDAIWTEISDGAKYDEMHELQKAEIRQRCDDLDFSLGFRPQSEVYDRGEFGSHIMVYPCQFDVGAVLEMSKLEGKMGRFWKNGIDSVKYPDHLFNIGYFRSSYNSTGIEGIAELYSLPSLRSIFSA